MIKFFKKIRQRHLLATIFLASNYLGFSQQTETYDYLKSQREMIQRGIQAVLTCNGLFTSNRTLKQVYDKELKYIDNPIGNAKSGDYKIDWDRKSVTIGSVENPPLMRAVFREGIGSIILAPNQTFDVIDSLPIQSLPIIKGNPAITPWPEGDFIPEQKLPDYINTNLIAQASKWSFQRESPEQVTISLLIVHKGQIIHERYAEGIDMYTKTRTWSVAKSIAVTLIGMMVDQGKMELDAPLGVEWLPKKESSENDPRADITLRNVLNMSSGLYPADNQNLRDATGSGLSYWAGVSSEKAARNRGLIRKPGTYWDYENYDILLGVLAMKKALGNNRTYIEFPRKALFDKISMRNTFASTDRFGDFILSSQVYTTARDLARFGMLYEQNGVWNNTRLLSENWIDFIRTPAPLNGQSNLLYGGQWWLVEDKRNDIPKDAYAAIGNRGQFLIVVPSYDLVIVRRGLDYGKQGFNEWNLTREVLKAFPVDYKTSDE
ncbi:beta-lactamase family protein [Seonamhaeicola sp. MEBiC1930]|uniref:serine hydrolase domain-containing protein n=1 Tax=Seonamhaeicola sp. MEBiC01930 TaxID=2976768 RepID=UPI003243EFDA